MAPVNHLACRVYLEDRYVLVDATVDPPLGRIGLPFAQSWDGKSDTPLPVLPNQGGRTISSVQKQNLCRLPIWMVMHGLSMTDLTVFPRTYEMESCRADLVLRNCHAVTLDARRPQGRTIYMGQGNVVKGPAARISSVCWPNPRPRLSTPGAARSYRPSLTPTVISWLTPRACSTSTWDLGAAFSIEDIVNKIRQAATSTPPGQWIRCTSL